MTDSERSAGGEERDHGRDSGCDPGLLDELKCKAKGIAAQAEYNAAHGQELDDARAAFMAARAAYSTVRGAAEPLVAEAHRQLEELEDRVRCQLDREGVECINLAFGRIVERLDRCGHERGCCCDGDCDFDDDVRDCEPDDVPGRLAVIERHTKEAAECFGSLIGEQTVVPAPQPAPPAPPAPAPAPGDVAAPPPAAPGAAPAAAAAPAAPPGGAAAAAPTPSAPSLAALPARVQAVRKEIDAIAKATADGSWEPAKLYAAVLVARRHLKDVWRGFANVNEYMDCLCRALTCMVKGHAAIGELTRQAAVNRCHRESWKAACKYLEDNTVAEVLAEYLRVCADDHDDDRDRDQGSDRGPDRTGSRDRDGRRERHDRDDDHDHDRDRDDDHDHDDAGEPEPDRDRDDSGRAGQQRRRHRDDYGRYRAP
jgi:hypothetical protein